MKGFLKNEVGYSIQPHFKKQAKKKGAKTKPSLDLPSSKSPISLNFTIVNTSHSNSWTVADSRELYGFKRWGKPYYGIDSDGCLCVNPAGDERSVWIIDVAKEAYSLFNHGYLDLRGRVQAESLFWQICQKLEKSAGKGYIPEELVELKQILADQYIYNFSVFQSILDHWALDQLFPVAPLTRLKERPSVSAILVDITCDSDGKISKFIDLEDEKEY